jgi:Zn-dependent protease with chaperone function
METVLPLPATPVPFSTPGNIRRYRHEGPLFAILATISILALGVATLFTLGIVWLFLLWAYVLYLTVASYFVCYLRGNAVKVTAEQFPALYARFCACCTVAGVSTLPAFYLLAGDGMRNAFAARFLNRYYVVLLSDIVDALEDDDQALSFYIGHELGHVAQKHIARMWWLRVAMGIPLLGAAYSRAREYTCDQFGLACCPNVKSAIHAMSVLAAGAKRWRTMNTAAFIAQGKESGGFWMSINELTGDYPWLCKRVACLQNGDRAEFPRRHLFAWVLAALVPRTGLGLIGAAIIYSYLLIVILSMCALLLMGSLFSGGGITGVLRSISAGPVKQNVVLVHDEARLVLNEVETFIEKEERMPESLADLDYNVPKSTLIANVVFLEVGYEPRMIVNMKAPNEAISLVFTRVGEEGEIEWKCSGGPDVQESVLPEKCKAADTPAAEEESPARTGGQ